MIRARIINQSFFNSIVFMLKNFKRFILRNLRKYYWVNRTLNRINDLSLVNAFLGKYDNFEDFFANYKNILGNDCYRAAHVSLKPNDYKDITRVSRKASNHLAKSINSNYFTNLENYVSSGWIFDKFSNKSGRYRRKFHLYPPNLLAINYIVNFIQKENIFDDSISVVDIPSGIGNFLGYLSREISVKNLIMVDNFSQISADDINRYQNQTFGIKVYESIPIRDYTFCCVICLPCARVESEVFQANADYLIVETRYLQPDGLENTDEFLNRLLRKYEAIEFNEIVSIFKRRNKRYLHAGV